MAKPKSKGMVIRSGHHLSPVAKVTVLAHAMETVSNSLSELAALCDNLGEGALGREARTIADSMLGRRYALEMLCRQAEQSKPEIKPYGSEKDKKAKGGRRRVH